MNQKMADREKSVRRKTAGSLARFERSQKFLAGGVSSGLRRSARPYPLFFSHGQGSSVFDVDGNRYLDYGLAWGPLILGHAAPSVTEAVCRQAQRGLTFGAQHDLEVEVAEKLTATIPCAELVAYSNSGTEIVQVALRLARAITGKRKHIKLEGHYHGWSDEVLLSYKPSREQWEAAGDAPVATGQGQLEAQHVVIAQWNDVESVRRAMELHEGEIAALICEPLLANNGCIPPQEGFLQFLRKECSQRRILLIFDEVITGFRLALGGGQEFYGVSPDLATFAKAVGAGTPLSVLAGKREYMDWIARGAVVHAGTLNGNPLALAAAQAALGELSQVGVYPRLHEIGNRLKNGLRRIFAQSPIPVQICGEGPVFQVHFAKEPPRNYRESLANEKDRYADFLLALLDEGVIALPDGRWYTSTAHSDADVEETLEKASRAASSLVA